MTISALEVLIHDVPAGTIHRGQHEIEFWMHGSYLEHPRRPVLGQYFETRLGKVKFSGKRGALPGFFANLVPEPKSKVRRVLAEANGLDPNDDMALLAALGADLHGAVTVRAARGVVLPDYPAQSDPEPGAFRFSLPGQQLKFSMSRDEHRFVIPAKGQDGDWIVKITGPAFPHRCTIKWRRLCGETIPLLCGWVSSNTGVRLTTRF